MMSPSYLEIERLKKVAKSKPSLQPTIQRLLRQLEVSDRTVGKAASSEAEEHRLRLAWSMNFAKVPVDEAREFARQKLSEKGMSVEEAFPNFEESYMLVKKKTQQALDIPRHKMPVIEPEQIDDFMEDLQKGHVDIFQPWAKGEMSTPEGFRSKEEAEEWITLGLKDQKKSDDRIRAKLTTMPASELRPTQGQIWYDKIVKNVLEFGPVDSSSPILDMTIIVSEDGYLLDGHHRWAGVMMGDPSLKQSVLHVPMNIQRLLEISRSYGFALGNEPKQ